ncbi:VWA domain-containing protein [Streptomyces sp. NPDC051940]|uniref:VWA domain-containing protein n=1 Tax=Streptomyces sp. NPDC051940 TaxID=3155675 RepID=UPI00343F943C
MSLKSPDWLWLLVPLALIVAAYVVLQRRRSSYAVRFTTVELLDKVAPRRPGWRRHVPAAAFCAMLCLLVVGFARPTAEVQVPRERATIMIALDVSGSMEATDVRPSRVAAAKEAARRFVAGLPERFNVGLVLFSSAAPVVVPPTTDHEVVRTAVARLEVRGGTAIGEAVFSATQAIRSLDEQAREEPPPAHVVLLSDGENTAGRPIEAGAEQAVADGVPVSTIAYGTENGAVEIGGRLLPVPVDGPALEDLAATTGGSYHEAASGNELQEVYDDIGSSVGHRSEQREIWPWFVAGGLVAALLAAATSLLWFSRIP